MKDKHIFTIKRSGILTAKLMDSNNNYIESLIFLPCTERNEGFLLRDYFFGDVKTRLTVREEYRQKDVQTIGCSELSALSF